MRMIFKGAGIATLFLNAYFALSLIALSRQGPAHLLPPLGWESAQAIPRIVIVLTIVWTSFLAVGCLAGYWRAKK